MESSLRWSMEQKSFNRAMVKTTQKMTQVVSRQMDLKWHEFRYQLQLQQKLAEQQLSILAVHEKRLYMMEERKR